MELLECASQLQALNSALSQVKAREGQGGVALVYGESGIGKTSLVEHFINDDEKSRLMHQVLIGDYKQFIRIVFVVISFKRCDNHHIVWSKWQYS